MATLKKADLLDKKKKDILTYLDDYDKSILSVVDLKKILTLLQIDLILPSRITRTNLIDFLIKIDAVKEVNISLPKKNMTKYIYGNVSIYEIALSINPKSYLSHYSALYVHELTQNIPKTIYTNMEQFRKSSDLKSTLIQENIDRAFSRPMRKTNNTANIDNYKVILLNGKNLGRLEVITKLVGTKNLPVTSVERTLIDIVIRPEYSGGILEIIEAYKAAKDSLSISKLIATLNNMNFSYPYHQAIGFYLERAGYDEKVLKRFDKMDKVNDFYLTYQMKDKSYSQRWKIYYPTYLD